MADLKNPVQIKFDVDINFFPDTLIPVRLYDMSVDEYEDYQPLSSLLKIVDGGKTLNITFPDGAVVPGHLYAVSISSGLVASTSSDKFSQIQTVGEWQFSTIGTTLPYVVEYEPAAEDWDVTPDLSEIRMVWSENVLPTASDGVQIRLYDETNGQAEVRIPLSSPALYTGSTNREYFLNLTALDNAVAFDVYPGVLYRMVIDAGAFTNYVLNSNGNSNVLKFATGVNSGTDLHLSALRFPGVNAPNILQGISSVSLDFYPFWVQVNESLAHEPIALYSFPEDDSGVTLASPIFSIFEEFGSIVGSKVLIDLPLELPGKVVYRIDIPDGLFMTRSTPAGISHVYNPSLQSETWQFRVSVDGLACEGEPCFNGGVCISDLFECECECQCTSYYKGPTCQFLHVEFINGTLHEVGSEPVLDAQGLASVSFPSTTTETMMTRSNLYDFQVLKGKNIRVTFRADPHFLSITQYGYISISLGFRASSIPEKHIRYRVFGNGVIPDDFRSEGFLNTYGANNVQIDPWDVNGETLFNLTFIGLPYVGSTPLISIQVYQQNVYSGLPWYIPNGISHDMLKYPDPRFVGNSLRLVNNPNEAAIPGSYLSDSVMGDFIEFQMEDQVPPYPDYWEVYYGPPENPERYKCALSTDWQESLTYFTPKRLACRTKPFGVGKNLTFTLVNLLGERFSSQENFYSYADMPSITSVSGCPAQDPNDSSRTINCPTVGGIRLDIKGLGFDGEVSVTIGSTLCENVEVASDSQVYCTLPPGSGKDQTVSIRVTRTGNNIFLTPPSPLVTYSNPTISQVSGCEEGDTPTHTTNCARVGGQTLTIFGNNFGPSGASVRIGATACVNVTHGGMEGNSKDPNNHGKITCTIQQGSGIDRSIVVLQEKGSASLPSIRSLVSFQQCLPGTYAVGFDCPECPSGRYSNVIGLFDCIDCPAGQYQKGLDKTQCVRCPRGRFQSNAQETKCDECPRGRYSPFVGYDRCDPCPRGTYGNETELASCPNCENGFFQPEENATECLSCGPGTYTSTGRNFVCSLCEQGKFSRQSEATACTNCARGYKQPNYGASSCHSCEPGTFSFEGQESCSSCPRGSHQGLYNQSRCIPCLPHSYSNTQGAAECTPCEGFTFQKLQGEISCLSCPKKKYAIFKDGIYDECSSCPENAKCDGTHPPRPHLGYFVYKYAEKGTYESFKCMEGTCLNAEDCGPNRLPPYFRVLPNGTIEAVTDSTNVDDDVRENPLCGLCVEGYYQWGNECVACDGIRWDLIAGAVFATFLFVYIVYKTSQSTSGEVKVFMYFVQMAVLFLGEGVDWLSWMEVFNLNAFEASGTTCIMEIEQHNRMLLSFTLPLASVACLLFINFCHFLLYKSGHPAFKKGPRVAEEISQVVESTSINIYGRDISQEGAYAYHPSAYKRTLLGLYLFTYNALSKALFEYFDCVDIGGEYNIVRTFPAVSCESSEYKKLM